MPQNCPIKKKITWGVYPPTYIPCWLRVALKDVNFPAHLAHTAGAENTPWSENLPGHRNAENSDTPCIRDLQAKSKGYE